MGKKLYKSKDNKIIFGVCGGIGEYFEIDPTLVRLAVALTWCFGIGIIGYIIAALIIPNQPQ